MSNANSLMSGYEGLEYSQADLKHQMRIHYDKIIDFVTSAPFMALMEEMSHLSHLDRPRFVHEVLLNNDVLTQRGVMIPDGILIQRSAFGDRRPTLFAVKHFLPAAFSNVWQNVNITFDNAFVDTAVSRTRAACWRKPITPHAQAEAMAAGMNLEEVSA